MARYPERRPVAVSVRWRAARGWWLPLLALAVAVVAVVERLA